MGRQVCEICNSNSFHSFIFKLCVMIIHTLKIQCVFNKYFHFFNGVELRHFFYLKLVGGVWFV